MGRYIIYINFFIQIKNYSVANDIESSDNRLRLSIDYILIAEMENVVYYGINKLVIALS